MSGLYAIDVTTFEDAGRFGRCMRRSPSERRERIARLRLPEDRRRSLGAGWLLAEVLLRYFGLESPELGRSERGKPYVKGWPQVQFSLSHAGIWAVCAADIHPVGVDVESVRPDRLAVAARFFAPEEQEMLRWSAKEAQDTVFARIWTRKEAYLKYTGEGLSHPLSTFSPASPDEDGRPVWDPALGCFFTSYTLPDGTPLALCTQDGFVPPSIALLRVE